MKSHIIKALLAISLLALLPLQAFASSLHPSVDPDSNNSSNNNEDVPRLTHVYATKDTFDPGANESTKIVFTLTEEADTVITIFRNNKEIDEILDTNELDAGTYAVEWKAEDEANDFYTYTYEITAENSAGHDTATGDLLIQEENKSSGKPNITRDEIQDLPYYPQYNNLNIDFKLDRDADITLEIRIDDDTIATPLEDVSLSGGQSSISWDGRDEFGDMVGDGIYAYKLIAANSHGKDVEFGNFEIQESFESKYPAGKCASFKDVAKDAKVCDAIEWAKNNQIFEGYSDSSFRPDKAISRAEALKVILTALEVRIQDYNGENLGFWDISTYQWYSQYLKTALSLGIIHGYSDGTFRPDYEVTRVEALTMILNTAIVEDHIIIPSNTYGQPYYDTPNTAGTKWYLSYAWFARDNQLTDSVIYFYPDYAMTRGEMADMLYRYSKI